MGLPSLKKETTNVNIPDENEFLLSQEDTTEDFIIDNEHLEEQDDYNYSSESIFSNYESDIIEEENEDFTDVPEPVEEEEINEKPQKKKKKKKKNYIFDFIIRFIRMIIRFNSRIGNFLYHIWTFIVDFLSELPYVGKVFKILYYLNPIFKFLFKFWLIFLLFIVFFVGRGLFFAEKLPITIKDKDYSVQIVNIQQKDKNSLSLSINNSSDLQNYTFDIYGESYEGIPFISKKIMCSSTLQTFSTEQTLSIDLICDGNVKPNSKIKWNIGGY